MRKTLTELEKLAVELATEIAEVIADDERIASKQHRFQKMKIVKILREVRVECERNGNAPDVGRLDELLRVAKS